MTASTSEGFAAACRDAGARTSSHEIACAADDLLDRWGAPDRGYHDPEHLTEVLDRLDELGGATPTTVLAAWFHDAVYEGRPGRDERDSAALASSVLRGLGVPDHVAARVADLVLVTVDHAPADGDAEAAALCDADLAILAATPARYARYVEGVRHDHRHVGDADFAAGRAAVLADLAGRPELFRTRVGQARWDARARRNLADEIERWVARG